MRNAVIYARISTGEQTPDNQLIRLREAAERAGWAIVCEYVETASGASRARPGLDAMVKDAARRRFDVVMAWDVSRLGRSLHDLGDLFEMLRSVGCDLFLEQQALDTSTPVGRALLLMSGVFAEFERAMIVERTKAGMARARARGKQIGRAPASDALIDAVRAQPEMRQGPEPAGLLRVRQGDGRWMKTGLTRCRAVCRTAPPAVRPLASEIAA